VFEYHFVATAIKTPNAALEQHHVSTVARQVPCQRTGGRTMLLKTTLRAKHGSL
jgi:hypothetical protein